MTLKTVIGNTKDERTVRVTEEGAFVVTFTSALPIDEEIKIIPFASLLTIGGVPVSEGGVSDLNVDGSTTSVDAFVTGQEAGDLYLTTANIVIADSPTVALNLFGGIAALTNGVLFFYEVPSGRKELATSITTNFDFIRLASLTEGLGSKNDAYQVNKLNAAGDDGYNPVFDLGRLSPLNTGIRIRKNSNDKLGFCIRDDLTAVNTFNVIAIGYIRLIDDVGE